MLSELLVDVELLLESLTILFPGFLSYFVYIGLRADDFERLKRSHIVLILFFTLLFQVFRSLSGDLLDWVPYRGLFYFALPVLVGMLADVGHRLFVTVGVVLYQERFIDRFDSLKLIDVGNVTRWQKTVSDYVQLGDVTDEYYVEVDVESGAETTTTKRGFLNGYSDDDIELIRYDDLSEKSFPDVGIPDIDEDKLTLTIELIPREKIVSVRIYRVRMRDFELH